MITAAGRGEIDVETHAATEVVDLTSQVAALGKLRALAELSHRLVEAKG